MCRELSKYKKYVEEGLKHHGSPNGGVPTGVRDEFPGGAEGRSAEFARADIPCRRGNTRCGRSSRCAVHPRARPFRLPLPGRLRLTQARANRKKIVQEFFAGL